MAILARMLGFRNAPVRRHPLLAELSVILLAVQNMLAQNEQLATGTRVLQHPSLDRRCVRAVHRLWIGAERNDFAELCAPVRRGSKIIVAAPCPRRDRN